MRIESRSFNLISLDLDHIRNQKGLYGNRSKKVLPLSRVQFDYLQLLSSGATISALASHFRRQGRKMEYQSLLDLIEFLAQEGMIQDTKVTSYFSAKWAEPEGVFSGLVKKLVGADDQVIHVREEVLSLPFFRVLDSNLVNSFLKYAKVIEAPKNIFICQGNQLQRSLFVLLRGQVSAFKQADNGRRIRIATLSQHSVFGEVGFFLGEKRTADIVTDEESVILQIQHHPSYDQLFKSREGAEIQSRFWLIHALESSSVFKTLPDDCFDELALAGHLAHFQAKHRICVQGDPGTSVYIIIKGQVKIIKNGKETTSLNAGEAFGEIALLRGDGIRTATVETTEESTLLEITQENFNSLLANNLMLACEFERMAKERMLNV